MEIKKEPEIRYLKEMEKVLYDKERAKNKKVELYYMYRGIKEKDNLRYDITVIPSKLLGNEFVKTKGHSHLNKRAELYHVLEGEAIFLIQKGKEEIKDVFAIKAKKCNWVKIPKGYAHITINPSSQKLRIANWVSKDCKNYYQFLEKMQGACYYYTKQGWIKNKNYKKVPKLKFKKPLKEKPKNLDFLNVSHET